MRILFTSLRNIGHFQPLVPLIVACRSQGHEVFVSTPSDLQERVEQTGATFLPFGHPGDEGLRPLWSEMKTLPSNEQNRFVMQRIFAGACVTAALPRLLEHVERVQPQVIVREAYEFAGLLAGQCASVATTRVAITLEAAQELGPALLPSLDQQRQTLGLPLDPGGASLESEPILTQFPPSLWPPGVRRRLFQFRLSGSIHEATPRADAFPLPKPAAWLGRDDAPLVYLTLGTVAGSMEELRSAYRLLLDAVADLPVRALLTTGEAVDPQSLGPIPERVHVERFVPQAELLPHVRAIVCHGGSGTVLGALGAGVPLVVMPMFADQPENARRIADVGAGLFVPLAQATAERLAQAIRRTLSEPAFAERARSVAAEMRELPSVSEAPDWLASHVGR